MTGTPAEPSNFIRHEIERDLAEGRVDRIVTRFPPEPNGFLHIGHAKSICLNFGLAEEYGGVCNLRYDDTNPLKESQMYVDAILEDVRWLGFNPGERIFFASDYFEQLYRWAEQLIEQGLAYVDQQTPEQIREQRGTLTQPGTPSPYRDRPPAENLELFRRMRAGAFAEGECVLRAKIDMASPNLNLRDPVMYRVLRASHHRTGDAWCIYPMYDWAHGQSDAIEGVTHSLCTLEFEDHRPLYEWFLEALRLDQRPRQIEFARLNLSYTVLSKRKLIQLVEEGLVAGWDDPRMPTIAGLRRRGVPPEAIRDFCERIGVAKANSMVDIALLQHCIREALNRTAPRRMAVFDPLRVEITTMPEGETDWLEADNNPEDPSAGTRKVPFTRHLYVERDDFRDPPPRKWRRLAPGAEVRLQHAYYVRVDEVVRDDDGHVVLLRCTHDPASRGGWTEDGRKVKGTIHWVSAEHATAHPVRLYDHLFTTEQPDSPPDPERDWRDYLNPESCTELGTVFMEPELRHTPPGTAVQFLRNGYFFADPVDSRPGQPVFNRVVPLRDSWAKQEKRG